MKKYFALAALAALSAGARADLPDYHVMRVLEFNGGAYIANPVVANQWIAVDDNARTCTVFNATADDKNGAHLVATDGREAFVADWSVLYTRPNAKADWVVSAGGDWIESGDELAWTHLQMRNPSDTIPKLHHFLWQGAEQTFINDPRPGENFYHLNPLHGKTWYRADRKGGCEVLTEKARTYGEPDLQTVNAGTWTIETGHATDGHGEIPGNWLGR